MTVMAMLRVTPVTDDDVTEDVAGAIDALESYDVTYRTNAMSTVVQADDVDELMAALAAAHKAVPGDHVNTLIQLDDKRDGELCAEDKVAMVEEELGREAASDR